MDRPPEPICLRSSRGLGMRLCVLTVTRVSGQEKPVCAGAGVTTPPLLVLLVMVMVPVRLGGW